MNRIIGIAFILLLMQAKTLAQTEGKGIDLSGTNTYASENHLLSDSMTLHIAPQFTTPPQMSGPSYGYHNSLVETTKQGGVGFNFEGRIGGYCWLQLPPTRLNGYIFWNAVAESGHRPLAFLRFWECP